MSKHEPLSAAWLRKYRQGELSKDERVRLEALRTQDPFVADALEGIEKLSSDEYATDVPALRTQLAKRTGKRTRHLTGSRLTGSRLTGSRLTGWWPVAASLVLLAIASFLLYTYLATPAAERLSNAAVLEDSAESLAFRSGEHDRQSNSLPWKEKAVLSPREATQAMTEPPVVASDPDSGEEETSDAVPYPIDEQTSQTFSTEAQQDSAEEGLLALPARRPQLDHLTGAPAIGEGEVVPGTRTAPVAIVRKGPSQEMSSTSSRGGNELVNADQSSQRAPRQSSERGRRTTLGDRPPVAQESDSANPSPESTPLGLPTKVATGQVVDEETNEPLPGVNVLRLGSNTGTVTDLDGRFSLVLSDEADSLAFNSIGYTTKEVTIRAGDSSYVRLTPDTQALSEVVVVGYGESRVSNLENSFSGARPIGGRRSFRRYLRDSQRHPADWSGKVVTVRVRFEVGADGTLRNFSILRSGGEWFDQEAVRLIEDGPAWTAAVRGGEKVALTRIVKVKFNLRQQLIGD